MTLEEIIEAFPDEGFLRCDGLDAAVIGVDQKTMNLVYSVEKCIEVMVNDQGMDHEEAREFLDFNTFGAYVGPKTPIYIYD